MLLRFEVANHRSILDPVEFSMVAVDKDREAARSFERLSESVLTVAGIYGPNASGKSNILDAISWLSFMVGMSLLGGGERIARDPHLLGDGPDRPTAFDMDLVVDGVRYSYQLEVDDSAVLYESLHSYPERRRRTLFEREGDEVRFRRGLRGIKATEELLTPTTLVLSAARRVGDPAIKSAARVISRIAEINGRLVRRKWGRETIWFSVSLSDSATMFEDAGVRNRPISATVTRGEAALGLLRLADPGINGFDIIDHEDRRTGDTFPELRFLHEGRSSRVLLRFEEESAGTQSLFYLLGPVFDALADGQILLFDEADGNLHPRLSASLIRLFQDPRTNPHGAQLILTTHDTSLLSSLNRDEVWFTDKESNGSTQLVALAEYGGDKVRRSLNLERAYLQGRFGGIPDVDHVDMRRLFDTAEQAS